MPLVSMVFMCNAVPSTIISQARPSNYRSYKMQIGHKTSIFILCLQERGDGVSFVFSSAPTDVQFQTVVVGATIGQACLLLAAGKKGRWFMMPHAKAMIQQPRVPSSGLMPGSDVLICANEAIKNRDTLVKLLSRRTGNSIETVAKVLRRPFYMDSTKAQEFGVIDKGQGACNFKLWHDLLGKGSEGAVARELKVL
ncbi:hypothetical protein MRB53_034790 [Persea americana]|uniref:Uncharacterized protein n=1 Tax=Persea americana TaxID=3435 RepID=A0ACC2K3B9_PERAE|nr:hypothetical protein MRB53_034790 [Persea americana]